jgi:uncharacterized protein
MIQLFQALMPKEGRFFELFSRHAATLIEGAAALRDLLEGGEGVAENCGRIMRHENEADDIAREALLAVRRTFITPFDRADIRGLVNALDDSIDQMQKTAKAILLFEVEAFEPEMRELGDIIVKAAALTAEAVGLLANMRKNAARLHELTETVNRLEDESDRIYDRGMKALFLNRGRADPMAFIIGAEIYDHLEKVVDRFEDVSNGLSGILTEQL